MRGQTTSGLGGQCVGFQLYSEQDKSKLRAFKRGQILLSTEEDKRGSEETC